MSLFDRVRAKFGKLTTQQEADLHTFTDETQKLLDRSVDDNARSLSNLVHQSIPTTASREEIENWLRGELGRKPD